MEKKDKKKNKHISIMFINNDSNKNIKIVIMQATARNFSFFSLMFLDLYKFTVIFLPLFRRFLIGKIQLRFYKIGNI